MIAYAETSAVLSWLLGEPGSAAALKILAGSSDVLASALTLVECRRVLRRAVASGRLDEAEGERRRARLAAAADHWTVAEITDEVLRRAEGPFPIEPIRTLDALHLAAAVELRLDIGPLSMVSLDERVRANAAALGFEVLPSQG